ncbi:succinate CoA transferase [Polluticaenibacter yanchengensis]|uniref:Succinate CoA transferase n=1 Tax=Polluticaenibacter yanchengensis TaxID=3014562 RepID=A0ABT4UEZ4_9BACT|nr:succinate CoA transferase [Chitinophagaceae bacterium LY-5]
MLIKMYNDRIHRPELASKIITDFEAAALIKDGMVVGTSGFTKSGDSKAVLPALAEMAKENPLKITLISGASLGNNTDGKLADAGALHMRMPFQVDPVLRKHINNGNIYFIDQHLSETSEVVKADTFGDMDIAIIEACQILSDGSIVPTTSIGNSAVFAEKAKKIIIELNLAMPIALHGIHDIFSAGVYPKRVPIPIVIPDNKIGRTSIELDPAKIVAIVITDQHDSPADIAEPDEATTNISNHLLEFFNNEVKCGRLKENLMPLQAGIGKVANSVLRGFINSKFSNLTMFSEVLQDSTFDLIDAGKMNYASGSSITVSAKYREMIFNNLEYYKHKIVLRPQEISNSVGLIRRLGVISINTALECDIYGNVNSTHVSGTHMMNGIGGSEDFARNSYMSIFVTSSIAKGGSVSSIVPMVTHVDHTEHDVDVIVTDKGLADLRGLSPRQRAQVVIDNCVHEDYKAQLQDYFDRALLRGGHTPHLIEEAFKWHANLAEKGTMKFM